MSRPTLTFTPSKSTLKWPRYGQNSQRASHSISWRLAGYKISVRPEIFLKILYLNSSLSCVVYQKIDCTLTKLIFLLKMLRHFLGNYFAVWLRESALLIDNISFESVLISNSSVQDLMSCAELIISNLKMVKEAMKCKW